MTGRAGWVGCVGIGLALGCAGEPQEQPAMEDAPDPWSVVQDTTDRVAVVEGFSGPESVRYDADQDVYFVGNFNGDGGERDGNGFVSRVTAEGEIEVLRFATAAEPPALHAPRGMLVQGDTLWVVDVDGVHGFDRRDGSRRRFLPLSDFSPGFLNDVAAAPDGTLYVTDTGRSAVYAIRDGVAEVALEGEELGGPNGITWDAGRQAFLLMPWQPEHPVHLWAPGGEPSALGAPTPGRLDGVEVLGERALFASQTDSTLHLLEGERTRPLIRVSGNPADIGIDTRRGRVAVPYISLDRVEIWQLPAVNGGG